MGISNQIPNSRLAQPGVCTSTTRPASPYEGQVIYETDTNRVLVYDASAWVMIADTDQPPGLQLIKTQTIGTAVSSVPVTGVFSSEFDNYRIILSGGTSSTSQAIAMQFGPSSVTGYNSGYYHSLFYVAYSTGATTVLTDNNASSITYIGEGSDSNNICVDVLAPHLPKYASWGGVYPGTVGGWISGRHASTGQFTDFTLSVTGTLTGGTIRVYGYRN